jgi:hypothetical protein
MMRAMCLVLLSVLFVCLGFAEHSPSFALAISGTHTPVSSAPDCRIQTC